MSVEELTIGKKVHYSPIIGGKHDGKIYTVRSFGMLGSRVVVWLNEKTGCVAIEALSEPA